VNWSRLLLAAVIAAPVRPAAAQNADVGEGRIRHHPSFLVSTDWLAQHLQSPGVVVVQVGRSDAGYLAAHIPGARFLPLSTVATDIAGVPNEFPPEAQLAATFRDLGVGDSTHIVIYGDDPGLLAARAWIALDLLGQSERASLLDGGLVKWQAERRPVEAGAHPATPRPFTARWQGQKVVSAAWVRSHLRDSTVFLVDARSHELYAGSGHLPGARDVYWMTNLVSAENPALNPMHALHEGIWKAAGADRPAVRTVVTYCHTGMQASFDYFVARYVGYPDVRLYDGSMAEWSQLRYPVEQSPN
jgi:thiosulfate/3-mercaptopyruvate sulfurtransferase